MKGKTKPIKVYELVAYQKSDLKPNELTAIEKYLEGLKLYIEQNFTAAIEKFSSALKSNPNDGPSQTYIKRCEYLAQNPPPSDWDGVFHMTTK